MKVLSTVVNILAFIFLSTAWAQDQDPTRAWCDSLQNQFDKVLKWRIQACKTMHWKTEGSSVEGRPLVYAVFGDEAATNTTLILTMVHGDEITPLFIGVELSNWLTENAELLKGKRVVLAPLVNPDGFFKAKRSRTNAHGVDTNRNFATSDWNSKALPAWKTKFRSDPRRYPGSQPNSEPETLFQKALIDKFKPQKILSIHAPLNVLDYDGPSHLHLDRFSEDYVAECTKLKNSLKAVSTGYFPGSLGNYAGQELGIPTVTLELPSANPRKARVYWNKFKPGIKTMIEFKVANK